MLNIVIYVEKNKLLPVGNSEFNLKKYIFFSLVQYLNIKHSDFKNYDNV